MFLFRHSIRRTVLWNAAAAERNAKSPGGGGIRSKSQLAKLRKATGYSIGNCKKALQINENDFQKAVKWLEEQAAKEGWSKAEKLQGRKTSQGLIGVLIEKNLATFVEVNCETDFVSKNQEFISLVSTVASSCHSSGVVTQHTPLSDEQPVYKVKLDKQQLLEMAWHQQQTGSGGKKRLSDLLALKIGQLGENMTLSRATLLKAADHVHLGCYVHPVPEGGGIGNEGFLHGKYGAVVAFEKASTSESEGGKSTSELSTTQCGWQLSQHVVGMNPATVGSLDDPPLEKAAEAEGGEGEEETRMVHQEFLLDPLITVGDFLQQNSIRIVDFVRFECGEEQQQHQQQQDAPS